MPILAINLDDFDVTPYINILEENDTSDVVEDFKFSDCKIHSLESFKDTIQNFEIVVLDNDNIDLSSMFDEYTESNNNNHFFDIPQSMFR